MKKLLLGTAVLLLSFGCSASHTLKRADNIPAAPTLDPTGSMFVNLPTDGGYFDKTYESSGLHTQAAVATAFAEHLQRVDTSSTAMSASAGLQHAASTGFTYFVNPAVLHWEDRATEWSGKPDKIMIQVDIHDTATSTLLDSITFQGSSKWATFGGDHPQDLLAKPLLEYAGSLF